MFERYSQQSSTLFATSKRHINVIVDKVLKNKFSDPSLDKTSTIAAFHDINDESMIYIIESFIMGDIIRSFFDKSGLQATFFLKDTSNIELNLITEVEIFDKSVNKEFILTKCAAESILKLLHREGLLDKQVILFQARRGNYFSNNLRLYTSLLNMIPSPQQINPPNLIATVDKDTVASVYAYLDENQITIFFNEMEPEKYEKIKSLFSNSFKAYTPTQSLENIERMRSNLS